ncbi:hypothetical protein HCUR_01522 [Holospora curviuscula]|uniref:Uncharacterized protein n=1 Tax=Holospora curviuscula TaxID=1082868 RepID=A0A2S5R6Y3_9PROT|nr:hypothetical protein HCUR_01522 [Holospora curviuscula]
MRAYFLVLMILFLKLLKDFRYTSESSPFSPNISYCSDQSTGTLFIKSTNFECLGCSLDKIASFSLGSKKFKRKIS